MKLAEALLLRADAQKRVAQLKERLDNNAKVQEGEQPAENAAALIDELERTCTSLVTLMQQINRTNARVELEAGVTLADALAARDVLMLKRNVYNDLAAAASTSSFRYSRSEVKYLSTVNVTEIRKVVDALSREHRELDARIQAANWNIDLLK